MAFKAKTLTLQIYCDYFENNVESIRFLFFQIYQLYTYLFIHQILSELCNFCLFRCQKWGFYL